MAGDNIDDMEDGDREILENTDIIGKLRSKGNSISILQKLKKGKQRCQL